ERLAQAVHGHADRRRDGGAGEGAVLPHQRVIVLACLGHQYVSSPGETTIAAPWSRSTGQLLRGSLRRGRGAYRSRTGVLGFADPSLTTRPRRPAADMVSRRSGENFVEEGGRALERVDPVRELLDQVSLVLVD